MSTKNIKKNNNVPQTKDQGSSELPAELVAQFNLKANMEGVTPRLPQINIVHRAELFELPDETQIKEFEGIILDTNRINAWWKIPYGKTGGGTPPDCFSMNGIEPDLNCNQPQAEKCAECAKNKFGTAVGDDGQPGRGKACKNIKRVHVMLENEMLPHRLTLPPSNLRSIDMYISLLTSKGLPYQLVTTKFKLKKSQNKDGVVFSEINPEKTGVVTDFEKAEHLKKLLAEFKPIMRGQEIVMEEYREEEA